MINKKILNKKNKLKFYEKNFTTLLVSRDREFQIFLQSFLASALSQKKKTGVNLISEKPIKNNLNQTLAALGITKFISFKRFSILNFILLIKSMYQFILTIYNLNTKNIKWLIKDFKIDNIYIGDLVYDSYIRYNLSFLKKNITFKLLLKIFISIFKFNLIKNLLIKKKIKYVVCEGGGYANLSGLTARIAANLKINIYSISYDRKNNFTLIDQNKLKSDPNAKGRIRRFKKTHILQSTKNLTEKKLNKFISDRNFGKITTIRTNKFDILNSNKNKNFYNKKKFIKKVFNSNNLNKKIVLIAAHVFSDCPHLDGENYIFNDYYDHYTQTLDYIKNNNLDDVYWIIKPHPSTKRYSEDNIATSYAKNLNFRNFGICPKDISTDNLVNICDNVITVTGTIALEFAVKGKLSINAGITQYSRFNITMDHYNQKSYFKSLENINKIKKLSVKQTIFAKKIFYFLENLFIGIKISNSDFLNLARLDPNKKNDQDMIMNKNLINYLKKKNLSNDQMIKDLYKKI